MSNLSTIRHDEIFDARKNNQRITIIGAGATGSRLFAALVELGLDNITIVDFDKVESHNLANQLFVTSDIGHSKVDSLRHWWRSKTGMADHPDSLQFIDAEVPHPDAEIKGTVFLLTDTMSSRREIYETCLKNNPDVYRVIETRMASSYGNIYTFNPNDPVQRQKWEDSLIDDDDAEVSHCGSSISVGTTASIIANLAAWQYMHCKTDPAAAEEKIDIFLKPLCVSTGVWA